MRWLARAPIEARLRTLYTATSAEHYGLKTRQGMIFAIKNQPPLAQPLLVLLKSAEDLASERVLLDPNQLDPSGSTTIDFYEPSLDGRLVAVSLSENGSEEGTLHIYEVATGRELGDLIPRVTYPTAGGSVAWNADGTGIYYTRYPQGDERPPEDRNFFQQVYFHTLGTPNEQDTYVIGADFPRIAEVDLTTTADGRYLLASVANGDGGEFAHYLRAPDGSWQQITHFDDQVIAAEFGEDDALYLLSRAGAPRGAILRLPLATPALAHARTIVPERDVTIEHVHADRDTAVCDRAGWRPLAAAGLRSGRQRAGAAAHAAGRGGARNCGAGGRSGADSQQQLHRAAGLVSLHARRGGAGAHGAADDLAGRFRRLSRCCANSRHRRMARACR